MAILLKDGPNTVYHRIWRKWFKLPMSIGGETHIDRITGADIENHAAKYGLDPDRCKQRFEELAIRIPNAIDIIHDRYANISEMDFVMEEYSRTVKRNCEAAIANLDRTHDSTSFVKPGRGIINSGKLSRIVELQQMSGAAPTSPVESEPSESADEFIARMHKEHPNAYAAHDGDFGDDMEFGKGL